MIETFEEFEAWLKEQSRETCVLIAYRASMRAVPFVTRVDDRIAETDHLALMSLRAVLISGVAGTRPTPKTRTAADSAARSAALSAARSAARFSALSAARSAALSARSAADSAALSAADSAARSARSAADSAALSARSAADSAARFSALSAADSAVFADAERPSDTLTSAAIRIADEILPILAVWSDTRIDLFGLGGPWTFWATWYARAMAGDPLPWDLQEQIALIPNDIWDAGPEAVAERIAEIEAEFNPQSTERPETVPPLEKAVLRQLVQGLLSIPNLTADFAISSAETVERAVTEYLNHSGENCLPPELEMLDALPGHFRRIATKVLAGEVGEDAIALLEVEIEDLNAKVARLEADLLVARSKTLDGRFKAVAIENLAKTVTSPWMIGAVAYGVCHFFGWAPSNWTLANLRGYAEEIQNAIPLQPK